MNFFDAYDAPGTTTPPVNEQPSLNEEVTQVVGQLSRFWGGFRKQSQTALEAARKDLGQVVQQAQKELTKLTAEAPPSTTAAAPDPDAPVTEQAASTSADADAEITPTPSINTRDASEDGEPSTSQPSQSQNLFTRLQSSLPPSLVSTVQAQLPESLKETLQHARAGSANLTALDFAQLRSTITTELHRVQGVTEEYVHRSEGFLREAGEFIKEAVKVVPPEEGDDGYSGLIWDGADVWMLPSSTGSAAEGAAGSAKGKEREGRSSSSSGRPPVDTLRAVATRAQSMLKQLRHDPEVIKADPNDDEKIREVYTSWLATNAASEEHGIGTTVWQSKVEAALADVADGAALQATLDTLVPEVLTPEEFWTRYFFRVYQVESEEARRKALIQVSNDNDEDFSWEDEEEDPTSPTTKTAPSGATGKPAEPPTATESPSLLSASAAQTPRSRVSTPGNLSPRQSSEDSYDVVSSQVSNSGAAEAGITAAAPKAHAPEEAEEDSDEESESEGSDWE
ncbi:hypothetical protein C2E23DRAFT_724835 [Lenzites betulinus]|nr:hypothetical protein C2E23DRAFT_724835 [Lenzites betulinus]